MTLANKIKNQVKDMPSFTMESLYKMFPDEKKTTIRGRVYDDLLANGVLKREGKGIYSFTGSNGERGVIMNGDARDLKEINSESVDLIIADHPYEIAQGRGRSFNSTYKDSTFEYELSDFQEKARVLKSGSFLIEFLPEMKETNLDYLIKVISIARESGFKFYGKVPWFKAEIRNGKLIDSSPNVGRKGVMEEIYIFSKGSPRSMRERKQGSKTQLEKGAKNILPAVYMEAPIHPSKRIHKAEKPTGLIQKLIENFSNEKEVVLDQFAGSLVTFMTALKMKRKAIAIELNQEFINTALGV